MHCTSCGLASSVLFHFKVIHPNSIVFSLQMNVVSNPVSSRIMNPVILTLVVLGNHRVQIPLCYVVDTFFTNKGSQ